MYRNNKPRVHRAGQSTVHHYTAGRARMTEVPAVWICQRTHVKPNCINSLFKSSPGSPSHILKCSPDLNRSSLHPPSSWASRISKSIFKTEIRGVQDCILGTFHTHRQKMLKRRAWGSLWSSVFFGLCVILSEGKMSYFKKDVILSTEDLSYPHVFL